MTSVTAWAGAAGGPAIVLIVAALVSLLVLLLIADRVVQQQAKLRLRFFEAGGAKKRVRGLEGFALSLSNEARAAYASIAKASGILRMFGTGDRSKIRLLLQSAGFRSGAALANFFGAKLVCSVLGCVGAFALVAGGTFAGNLPLQGAIVLVGFFVGGMLPEMALKRHAARRQQRIRTALPDAIDLLIIAANAGQSLEVSMNRVAKELVRNAPDLADELRVTTSEIRALPNRREALENLALRSGAPEVRSLTATLIQTIKYGTPLSQSLKVLAAEQRQAKLLALEEKAAKLPALLALPLMVLIMPSIFIVTAGPSMLGIGDALFGQ